jgi:hypothetical protein
MLLHLLLAHPEVVRRAVLIGATGGIEDPAERRARAADDEVLAQRIAHEGVDAFVERWLAMPMWAGLPEWAKFSQERRTNTATGLAGSPRLAGTGAQDNLWPRLVEIDTPVLVLAGEHDEKFTSIGQRLAAEPRRASSVRCPVRATPPTWRAEPNGHSGDLLAELLTSGPAGLLRQTRDMTSQQHSDHTTGPRSPHHAADGRSPFAGGRWTGWWCWHWSRWRPCLCHSADGPAGCPRDQG